MTVGDVLDGAFRGLRATFLPVLLVVVLIIAPFQLLFNQVLTRLLPGADGAGMFAFDPFADTVPFPADVGALVGAGTLLGVLGFLVDLIAGGAVVALVLRADRGGTPEVGAALRSALHRAWTMIAASLLLGLGVLFAFGLVILLGVLFAFLDVFGIVLIVLLLVPVGLLLAVVAAGVASLVIPIAIAEDGGPIATLQRALWVLRVRPGRLIGITLLVGLLLGVATAGLQLPFMLLSFVAGAYGWILLSVGEILTSVVAVPVAAFAALLVYLDARIRFEGYDLEIRARGLDPSSPS